MTKLQERLLPHMCRDGHAEIRHGLSDDDERCPVCRERDRADAAEIEIARLEEKISEIEGVWPDWASKLLDIIYPRDMRASDDEFDLPEDLKEWLAQCELQVRKAANRPAQPPAVGEDVVERAAKTMLEDFFHRCGLGKEFTWESVDQDFRNAYLADAKALASANLLRTKDAG